MPYQQIPLHYRRFFRSAASPKFEAFDRPQAFVVWIDILGVQRMQHADIVWAVREASEIAAECTSVGGIQSHRKSHESLNYPAYA